MQGSSRRGARRSSCFYTLADDGVLPLLAALHSVAERNAGEVDRILRTYFHERDAMEPVSRAELMRRIKDKTVIVLDVRPEDEYALGRIYPEHAMCR